MDGDTVSIRVVATDLDSGQQVETVVDAGDYVVITAPPCHIAGEVHHRTGTSVLLLQGRDPDLMATTTTFVAPGGGDMP